MFGYVVVNQAELKFREYELYRSYYCGFCRVLKERYGRQGQLTLSYDMTFLILLLTGLYEPQTELTQERCLAHPASRHAMRVNEFTQYAADLNVLLSYYASLDDWTDERSVKGLAAARLLRGGSKRAAALYEKKARCIYDNLNKLHLLEKTRTCDLDRAAGYFGEIMAELFDARGDVWSGPLRRTGFYLGKFIYLLDAYDDLERDQKKGSYNALLPLWEKQDADAFAESCKELLTMMMAQCCRAFELLPICENVAILRNILYSGVWARYEAVTARRKDAKKQ